MYPCFLTENPFQIPAPLPEAGTKNAASRKSYLFRIFSTAQNNRNNRTSVTTIPAPAGVPYRKDRISPTPKLSTESIREHIVTLLNVLQILIAVSGGKIIRAEISSAPIIRRPRTTVSAVNNAVSVL